MGIKLVKFTVERYRGLTTFGLENFGDWTTITGENSTNKSSLIKGISMLGSNEMHKLSDIPDSIDNNRFNIRDIPVNFTYLFELSTNFRDFVSDRRMLEGLILFYDKEINDREDENNLLRQSYEKQKNNLLLRTLYSNFYEALLSAKRQEFTRFPHYEDYKSLFKNDVIMTNDELIDNIKYIEIKEELVYSDGPSISIVLYDNDMNVVFSESAVYQWLKHNNAIDELTFPWIISAVYLKSITNVHKLDSYSIPCFLAYDGSNFEDFVEYYLTHHPEIFEYIYEKFQEIFGESIRMSILSTGILSVETRIIIKEEGKQGYALEKLSDGYYQVIRILFQIATCAPGDIIIIDEPELHLHPGAAKTLRDILKEKKDEVQIITATHSPLFFDPYYVDKIFLFKRKAELEMLTNETIDRALLSIGSDGLDALLYKIIIWCEGPTDKPYLKKWIELFKNDINIPIEQIGYIHYGGKGNIKHLKIEDIKQIARKSMFIIDSDKTTSVDAIDQIKLDFQAECLREGFQCWITERREIENYIPLQTLTREYSLPPGTIHLSKWEKVQTELERLGVWEGKVKTANKIYRSLSSADLSAEIDIYNDIKNNFIDKIILFL